MKRAFALSILAALVLACRTPVARMALDAGDPRPAQRVEALRRAALQRSALRATARLALQAPDAKLNRPQRIAVERPARMRVEILGLFDQLAAVLVTDGAVYQLYRAGEPVLEEGPVSADLLWRVARVDLEPREAVDLLLGVPRPSRLLVLSRAWLHGDGGIECERVDSSDVLRERLRFDAAGNLAEIERFDRAGSPVFSARFADYRDVPVEAVGAAKEGEGAAANGERAATSPFAHDVDLDFPRVDANAHFRFKRVSLPADIPDALFALKLPERAVGRGRADMDGGP